MPFLQTALKNVIAFLANRTEECEHLCTVINSASSPMLLFVQNNIKRREIGSSSAYLYVIFSL